MNYDKDRIKSEGCNRDIVIELSLYYFYDCIYQRKYNLMHIYNCLFVNLITRKLVRLISKQEGWVDHLP